MTALLLFAATFGVVFALGLQSLNVNGGHRMLAFVTSFGIGASNLVLFKVLPGPTSALEIGAYLVGGPFGIVAAMALHPVLVRWYARRRAA
jgi:predicted outer membrane lipoprotein